MTEKKRAGRNIKLNVTDDISHMGVTETEYRIIEDDVDPELNRDNKVELTKREEEFVVEESKRYDLEPKTLKTILEKYKKEHGKVI
ncbi:hypothetical protein [Bacillus sp. SJS]|uniref:hypothetical protein n=1 Tax=Bacillus sp. SJS TaxID=1423321 RepID=UPI0004DD6866|nr:hypothetical protein [Bacillus sp. SJS]KZZ83932.1 hypothetical protein AS29_014395 [Bacillus sp. SJS]